MQWDRWRKYGQAIAVSLLLAFVFSATSTSAEEGQKVVKQAIERFVKARMSATESGQGRTIIDIPPLKAFSVNRERFSGPLRTEISTRAPEPLRGRAPLAVTLYAGETVVNRSVVTPYIRSIERVVVPTRDIRVGDLLDREDFTYVDRDGARLPRDVVRAFEEVEGLRAKRSLRREQTFRASQVEAVPLVKRGDRVQLLLQSGSLRISGSGKAKETGAFGDWIRVVNMDSKRELTGRVDREGRVHVSF